MDGGAPLEPAPVSIMGLEAVGDAAALAIGEGRDEAVPKADRLDAAAPLELRRDGPARGGLESGKQGGPAVALGSRGAGPSSSKLRMAPS
jgi:hypothetical protein